MFTFVVLSLSAQDCGLAFTVFFSVVSLCCWSVYNAVLHTTLDKLLFISVINC